MPSFVYVASRDSLRPGRDPQFSGKHTEQAAISALAESNPPVAPIRGKIGKKGPPAAVKWLCRIWWFSPSTRHYGGCFLGIAMVHRSGPGGTNDQQSQREQTPPRGRISFPKRCKISSQSFQPAKASPWFLRGVNEAVYEILSRLAIPIREMLRGFRKKKKKSAMMYPIVESWQTPRLSFIKNRAGVWRRLFRALS